MPRRPRRQLAAWAIALVAPLLAWTLGCWWFAPGMLQRFATQRVQERLHRPLSVGAIHINPFGLVIEVEDLQLPDDGGRPMLGWRRATLDIAVLRSIAQRAPVIASARVETLRLDATRSSAGHVNLADLALLGSPDDGDTRPARYLIDQLRLDEGSLSLRQLQQPAGCAIRLDQLQLDANGVGTLDGHRDEVSLSASMNGNGMLAIRGHARPASLRADATIEIRGMPVAEAARCFGTESPFTLLRGTLSLDGQIDIDAGGPGGPSLVARIPRGSLIDAGFGVRGGTGELLKLSELTLTAGRFDLARREIGAERITVKNPDAVIQRDASGRLNIAGLLPRGADGAADVGAGQGWQWQLPAITLSGGELQLEDRAVRPVARIALHGIALSLENLSADGGKPVGIGIDLRVGDAGHASSQGLLRADGLAYSGHMEGKDLDLRPLQPYLQQAADLRLLSGALGFALDVSADPTRIQLRGEAGVRGLRTVDNLLKQDFLQWKSVHASGIEYDSAPRHHLRIHELVADAPYARVVVGQDRRLNLSQVLRQQAGEGGNTDDETTIPADPLPSTALSTNAGLDIAIDLVRVQHASANFADLWIQPHFAVGIQDLGGTIKGLSSQEGSRATIDLKGSVDRYAPVVIGGEINPLSAALFSDVWMSFRNIDLTSVTAYSGRFAGYEIRKGKLSVDLQYHIQSRRLDARHHLVADQFELGEQVESPEATSLPLRLAVALLKDSRGVIDVQLPVSGNLDDPHFRLGPLVWKMAMNLVLKAASAPFALLGELFGGGDEVNQLTFVPGTADLDEPGRRRLEALRRAMIERPGLRLDVPAAWSAEVDRPAMLRRQLEARLAAIAPEAGPDRARQLLAAWREETADAPLPGPAAADIESALLARYVVGDEELQDLGRRRAAAIQDLLFVTQEIDPVRVFVVDGKPAAADARQLRIDLLLK